MTRDNETTQYKGGATQFLRLMFLFWPAHTYQK